MNVLRRLLVVSLWLTCRALSAEEPSFAPVDPGVKAVVLDRSDTESFLAVQADTTGRLFVGGREALFVYELNPDGSYAPRRELYRFPKDTWIYDLAVRGDDLYALTVSALYVFPGARTARENLRPERLVWGVPLGHVHQCFHGLAIGPEGDVYFAMGDPLWYYGDFTRPDHWGHWTFFCRPEGTKIPYNGVGGVFKVRPDGSSFQIVARGLRNSCGLAFDRRWNLFTNDNDHESMPSGYVPGRLVHVVPQAYFNWPRGWLVSKTPDRADLLETMTDALGRAVPVGQAYYDDARFPAYRDQLLVARWCIRALTRYPLVPRGASFSVTEQKLLEGRELARPVGVSVGRDGRIFTTIAYMAQNEGSPIYQSDLVMLTSADDAPAAPFDAYDAPTAPLDKLWSELSHESWSRRQAAHGELLRRGPAATTAALERLEKAAPKDPAQAHLPWLVGASRTDAAAQALARRAASDSAEVRRTALRVIDEFALGRDRAAVFLRHLSDPDAGVQLAALVGLHRVDDPIAPAALVGQARSRDTYLRQSATLLLAGRSTPAQLEQLAASPDGATRLAAVLAAGFRLTLPPAVGPAARGVKLDALRTEADYRIVFPEGEIDVRKFGPVGNYTMADAWKTAPPTADEAQRFALLQRRLGDEDRRVRLQAAHFLSLLDDPRSEPQVAAILEADETARLVVAPTKTIAKAWLVGPFADGGRGFDAVHPPEQGAVDLAASYDDGGAKLSWEQIEPYRNFYNLAKRFNGFDDRSAYAYVRLESAAKQRIQLLVGSDDGVKVWHNGRLIHANDTTRGALPAQDAVLVELQPGANDLLVRVRNLVGESGLYLMYRSLGDVAATLPERVAVENLASRLASTGGAGPSLEAFAKLDWLREAKLGDPDNGRKLFTAVGCAKCHAVAADALVIGGPSLAEAGRRFTVPHLVESILAPGRQVSPVFKATTIETTDGRTLTGLVTAETGEQLELLQPDAVRVVVRKNAIESRKLVELSPMPQGIVKTPAELRDLLAYLLGN